MISQNDEEWLKEALKEYLGSTDQRTNKHKRLLEGFSMLVRNMAKNIRNNLNETQTLWEKNPTSKELRERFDSLAKSLFYLEKYCQEKIERHLKD